MTTLAQIIGVEKGVRGETIPWWNRVKQLLTHDELFAGRSETYEPEQGYLAQADKSQRVQVNAELVLDEVRTRLVRYWDLNAIKKYGDTVARADVVLADGTELLASVPVDLLIFLENQLADVLSAVGSMPAQNPAESWAATSERGISRTPEKTKITTAKVADFRAIPVGDAFPAEVREVTKDVQSGTWTTVLLTGAVTPDRRAGLQRRTREVLEAVQRARIEANQMAVLDQHIAAPVLDHIFGPVE